MDEADEIEQSIGNDVSQALIGLHCLTGCDSVSAFYGKGKKKALNLLLKDNELCPAFKDLGERFDIDADMVISIEKFVCKLYGQKDVETVNEARYNMFRLARKSEIAMPPNQDSLTQHIKRANYQAGMYLFSSIKQYSINMHCSLV
jgi:5'-3' exonuclease